MGLTYLYDGKSQDDQYGVGQHILQQLLQFNCTSLQMHRELNTRLGTNRTILYQKINKHYIVEIIIVSCVKQFVKHFFSSAYICVQQLRVVKLPTAGGV